MHCFRTHACAHTHGCVDTSPGFTKYQEGISEAAGLRGIWIHHREQDASHVFCSYHFDPDLAPVANKMI